MPKRLTAGPFFDGTYTRFGRLAAALAALAALALPAFALEEPPGEMPALKACEKRLCTMILDKSAKGDDLKCDVQKTWAKSSLEGGESKGVSWGFGDARCSVNLKLGRADIVAALTKPKHTVFIPAHEVNCVIEREGQVKPLTAKVAPKLVFKGGKADKVWINLESIDGPADVKSTIWTAAKLEDSIGIFHRPMIKSINKFMHSQCAKRYGPDAKPETADKKDGKDSKTKVAAPAVKTPAAKTEAAKAATKAEKPAPVKADAASTPASAKAEAKRDAPNEATPATAPPPKERATASAP